MFGTHADAPHLLRHWASRADEVALVAPFGVEAEVITATIDALGPPDTTGSGP